MRKINMKRKGRKEKVEQQNDDEQNGVESSDPKNSSEEEEKNSEEDAEPEPEAKRRKSDKRKSAATNKKAAKKEEEASEDEAQSENSEGDEPEPEVKRRKSDKRKSAATNKKASKKEEEASEDEAQSENSEGNEPEPEVKRRKSDKRKSAATNKKAAKKEEEEASEDEAQYEVQEVIDEKMVRGVRHYLIRWKGYEPESDTWEPESTLNCPELIKKFKDKASEENGAEPAKKNKKSEKVKPKKEKKVIKKESKDPDVNWESDDEFEVGSILDVYFKKNGKREFLVSWKGYSHAQDSWEPEENLDCTDLIKKFMSKVESAKNVGLKELRLHRTPTERFTLSMAGSGRRLSRRFDKKQRVQYHEAE